MLKTTRVLTRTRSESGAFYVSDTTEMTLDDASLAEMGEPETLTVTIEPGDRLNVET